MARLTAWQCSLALHFLLAIISATIILFPFSNKEFIEVPIYSQEMPASNPNIRPKEQAAVVLKSVNKNPEALKPSKAVFGISRNAHSSGEGDVEAKQGNTLAKAVDSTVLGKDDADALPTPTDEYLVSQMPVVINEIIPQYPQAAKEARQEGVVILDALIDSAGKVRSATIIEGPEVFRVSAMKAMMKFIFKPALVEGKPVAVRIRYTLKFRLEI